MIRQQFSVEKYWEVIVYYHVDYNLFNIIEEELLTNDITLNTLDELYYMMYSGKAKVVTFSSPMKHISIVLFNIHKNKSDYINSIVHEAEHIKQAMLSAYRVEDEGEPPAYTIGYLVSRMYEVFRHFMCG